MLSIIRNAFKIPDLRKKLIYTLFIIIVFRIGATIPVPFLNLDALKTAMDSMTAGAGNLLGYLNVLSGGAFASGTLFAMSVSPYINASIIIQLLSVAIPALERMSKEGEEGRKKLGQITRYTTVALGLLQGFAFFLLLKNYGAVNYLKGASGVFVSVTIVLTFTAGSALMMWLGEQINDKGIGNGISILLFAGILSRAPQAAATLWGYIQLAMEGQIKYYFIVPAIIIVFVLVIAFIVFMTDAERRVPVQYAKRVVGRKMYGGQSTHIPIKVNMSGVMPIIFASSFLAIPGTIKGFIWGGRTSSSVWYKILSWFDYNQLPYAIIYFLFILAFSYFYKAIQYNPIEMANNLRKNSGAIPGIRPGKPTSDFLNVIMNKVVLVGAIFLGFIAILPIIVGAVTSIGGLALGGTTILILVGVALETTKQIESQMLMRHYKGFLE